MQKLGTLSNSPTFEAQPKINTINKFLKENKKVLDKVIPPARQNFDYSLSDKFLLKECSTPEEIGEITVFKKAKKPEPVKAGILMTKNNEDRIFQIHQKGELLGSIITKSNGETGIAEILKDKKFEHIIFMKSYFPKEFYCVGRALHDVVKLSALSEQKRILTLWALHNPSPVGFHSKNNYLVMAERNKLSKEQASLLNSEIRKSSLEKGTQNILKKINGLFMYTVLPKK